jgi:hypothetical protein
MNDITNENNINSNQIIFKKKRKTRSDVYIKNSFRELNNNNKNRINNYENNLCTLSEIDHSLKVSRVVIEKTSSSNKNYKKRLLKYVLVTIFSFILILVIVCGTIIGLYFTAPGNFFKII